MFICTRCEKKYWRVVTGFKCECGNGHFYYKQGKFEKENVEKLAITKEEREVLASRRV